MELKNKGCISEFLDLQRKAILTLYTYTENLKTTTADINMSLNDIVADTEINKMDIGSLQNRIDTINTVQFLQNENTKLLLDSIKDISSNLTNLSKSTLELANSVVDIKIKHKNHIFYNMCDFIILVSAITAVYFFK